MMAEFAFVPRLVCPHCNEYLVAQEKTDEGYMLMLHPVRSNCDRSGQRFRVLPMILEMVDG